MVYMMINTRDIEISIKISLRNDAPNDRQKVSIKNDRRFEMTGENLQKKPRNEPRTTWYLVAY